MGDADRTSFVAAAYPTRAEADGALAALRDLAGEGSLALRDAAIVSRSPRGRIELQQTKQLAPGEGIVAGGSVGIVVGLLLGVPVAAALTGMAAAGGFAARDTGIPDDRLRALAEGLGPDEAALCALVERADWPLLRARLAPYRGEILVAELSAEAAAATAAVGDPPP